MSSRKLSSSKDLQQQQQHKKCQDISQTITATASTSERNQLNQRKFSSNHFHSISTRNALESVLSFNLHQEKVTKNDTNTFSFQNRTNAINEQNKSQKRFLKTPQSSIMTHSYIFMNGFNNSLTSPPNEISTSIETSNQKQPPHLIQDITESIGTISTSKSKVQSILSNITAENAAIKLNQSLNNQNRTSTANYCVKIMSNQGNIVRSQSNKLLNLSSRSNIQKDNLKSSQENKIINKIEELAKKREKLLLNIKGDDRFGESTQLLVQMFSVNSIILQDAKLKINTKQIEERELEMVIKFIQQEQQFHRFLKPLSDIFTKKEDIIKSEHLKQKQKDQEIQTLKDQVQDMINQINAQHKVEANYSERDLQLLQKNQQKESSHLLFENSKLQHAIKTLTEKLTTIERDGEKEHFRQESQQLTSQIQEMENKFQAEFAKKEQLIVANTNMILNLKAYQKKAETEIKYYKQYYEETQILTKHLTEENEKLQIVATSTRERFQMMLEDFTIKFELMESMKSNIIKNDMKIKKLQDKIDKMTLMNRTFIDPPDNPDFEEENKFFSSIKYIYSKNLHFIKQCRSLMAGIEQAEVDKNIAKFDKAESKNSTEQYANLNNYRYNFPTFFGFIEKNYAQNVADIRTTAKIPFNFIATIRGIFDSKFQEYLLESDRTDSFSAFPEFVYSWLQCFQIDSNTRKVTHINKQEQSYFSNTDQIVSHFYFFLHNPLLSKLWEVVTFRQFLNEDLSSEELYLYLFCRNALFKGPQLEIRSSTFEIINYIKFDIAETFVRQLMTKFDIDSIDYIVDQLKSKVVTKIQKPFIDVQVILRIIIEYLRTEKMQRYKLLKSLFYTQKTEMKSNVFSLTFQAFRKIFDSNYTDTTELEIAKIYRECHCVGKGIVNHDSFFAVCNENGFFIKQLKLKVADELPVYSMRENRYYPNDTQAAKSMDQMNKWLEDPKNEQLLGSVELLIQSFGNERMINKYLLFRQNIDNYHQKISLYHLKGRSYFHYIQQQFSEIQNDIISIFTSSQNELDINQILSVQSNILSGFSLNIRKILSMISQSQSSVLAIQNKKVQILQQWARKKISKWYNLLNSVMITRLLKISADKILQAKTSSNLKNQQQQYEEGEEDEQDV